LNFNETPKETQSRLRAERLANRRRDKYTAPPPAGAVSELPEQKKMSIVGAAEELPQLVAELPNGQQKKMSTSVAKLLQQLVADIEESELPNGQKKKIPTVANKLPRLVAAIKVSKGSKQVVDAATTTIVEAEEALEDVAWIAQAPPAQKSAGFSFATRMKSRQPAPESSSENGSYSFSTGNSCVNIGNLPSSKQKRNFVDLFAPKYN
jgi:hypothetical protein